ncbi:ATP-dependent DNA helicase RecG [bacterium]|nr:ATP-dependent DNA helicase RecG [bacterium]
MPSVKSSSSVWETDVQFLKGVGDKLAQIFAKAGVHTLWDLLLFLPRTYQDRRKMHSYAEMLTLASNDDFVIGLGVIERFSKKRAGPRGRQWKEALVRVLDPDVFAQGGTLPEPSPLDPRILFTWFRDPRDYAEKTFPEGSVVVFRGKAKAFRSNIQIVHPELQKSTSELPEWEFGNFVPVYREISTLSTRVIRKIMALALNRPEVSQIPDIFSEELMKKLELEGISKSIRELHFPKEWEPAQDASPSGKYLRRIAFEELFMMAIAMSMRKSEWINSSESMSRQLARLQIQDAAGELKSLKSSLPFALTGDQEKALNEVLSDLALDESPIPMHRLVQGDVGSGKTIIAFLSAIMMMKSGYQVAMMAPTEILANQHYQNFSKFFPEFAGQCMLLKGALTVKKKKEVRTAIAEGQCRFVIGTQALVTDSTLFDQLGLIIVDEQHRFGVKQRILMKEQSGAVIPHLLVMTATPIPRSLALTIYGDLNLSVIREKPAGRIPIETHLVKQRAHDKLVERLKKFLDEGRQLYLVYPLVEESEELDLKDVQSAHKEWSAAFGAANVGLLHGRMKSKEKDAVMQAFKQGELKVLVSTTVIEVGVDVPNASVIVVEHAERFGLSQLHQLRGRVGRGAQKSYCVLVGPDHPSPLSKERLDALVQSDDGFFIAEKDLEIRGPGEFLGRKQSGMPGFRVAHIIRDLELLEIARREAEKILEQDPKLVDPQNRLLKTMIERWWGGRMELTLGG